MEVRWSSKWMEEKKDTDIKQFQGTWTWEIQCFCETPFFGDETFASKLYYEVPLRQIVWQFHLETFYATAITKSARKRFNFYVFSMNKVTWPWTILDLPQTASYCWLLQFSLKVDVAEAKKASQWSRFASFITSRGSLALGGLLAVWVIQSASHFCMPML